MNNQTKAKVELARKMLSVKIDVSEVVLVTELPEEMILKIKEEVDEERRKNFEGLDELDHGLGFDSFSMAAEMEEEE